MIKRILYTIRMAWQHRKKISAYQKDPHLQINSAVHLNPDALIINGITAIAFDFDGVLAAHGENHIQPNIENLLRKCIQTFGSDHIFILSNKPNHLRRELFEKWGIELIWAARKKPYPDGIDQILLQAKLTQEKLVVVDDRLLTGILAAEISGAKAIWVTNPTVNLLKRPLAESFFIVLRKIERLIFY